jgi:hypothetical protein
MKMLVISDNTVDLIVAENPQILQKLRALEIISLAWCIITEVLPKFQIIAIESSSSGACNLSFLPSTSTAQVLPKMPQLLFALPPLQGEVAV